MPAAGLVVGPRVAEPAVVPAPLPNEPDEPPEPRLRGSGFIKPFVVLALPGMYLFYKYNQYRREQRELSRRRVTERELQQLHHKIDKLLNKLEENEPEMASSAEDECVICVNARATMQTAPCGHRVVCRRCFVKTIQMAVSQRLLPLRCVICRAKILRLKQTLVPRDSSSYSVSGKSWRLPQSASDYNMGASNPVKVTGSGGRWTSGSVPASASLYSMSSGSSSISGVSSVSSTSSSSFGSSGSSTLSSTKPRLRQPISSNFKKSQKGQPSKIRLQEYQDQIQQAPQDNQIFRENQRLPPIKEFSRDFKVGKTSTRLRCAQKIVTQLESTSSAIGSSSQGYPSTSSSSSNNVSTSLASSSSQASSLKSDTTNKHSSGTTPKKLTVAQEVQMIKKEKERRKEREKAEKTRLKEEQKAEKIRLKEAKKLAKEEKKRAKKEAKVQKKEAEQALLANIK